MTNYTVVTEDYDVRIYRSKRALLEILRGEKLSMFPRDERAANASELVKAFKSESTIRLYDPGAPDWKYRIQKH